MLFRSRRAAADTRWQGSEDAPGDVAQTQGEEPSGDFSAFYSGLTLAETLRNLKEWFSERMDILESEADDRDAIWQIRGYLENILDSVCESTRVNVAGRRIHTVDYLGAIQYYVHSRENFEALARIISEVNDRTIGGKIRNKKNYLISALYQGVKTEGG